MLIALFGYYLSWFLFYSYRFCQCLFAAGIVLYCIYVHTHEYTYIYIKKNVLRVLLCVERGVAD